MSNNLILTNIIHISQIGFILKGSIFQFGVYLQELAKLGEDLIVFILDFEKEYDRVDWHFLQDTMRKMGFDKKMYQRLCCHIQYHP
jgi:hypothetical protein